MIAKERKKHVIDLIFPIALFFVFAVSALLVLLLSVNLYSRNTKAVQQNNERYEVLSYLSEKIRQNDEDGGVSLTEKDGVQCLALKTTYESGVYVTYIYEYEGMLKELFIKEGTDVSLKDGSDITECCGLEMEETKDGLFCFRAADSDGTWTSFIASERSSL